MIQLRSLYPLADELQHEYKLPDLARRLRLYTTELYRRKGNYRTKAVRTTMTPELKQAIKAFARTHPTWDNQSIAERFNVNSARVSETLHGKRK